VWARNPTVRLSLLQTRWMPCSVASATSARARQDHHRLGAGVLSGIGGAAGICMASHRPVRQQPGRGRPCRLKSRLGPMRGLKQDRSARVIIGGHAFVQTFDGAITSWPLRSRSLDGCPSRSRSWPWRSEPRSRSRLHPPWPGAMQQRPATSPPPARSPRAGSRSQRAGRPPAPATPCPGVGDGRQQGTSQHHRRPTAPRRRRRARPTGVHPSAAPDRAPLG
jgi:hypothetical protein